MRLTSPIESRQTLFNWPLGRHWSSSTQFTSLYTYTTLSQQLNNKEMLQHALLLVVDGVSKSDTRHVWSQLHCLRHRIDLKLSYLHVRLPPLPPMTSILKTEQPATQPKQCVGYRRLPKTYPFCCRRLCNARVEERFVSLYCSLGRDDSYTSCGGCGQPGGTIAWLVVATANGGLRVLYEK